MHALDPSDASPLPALTLSRASAWRILLGLLQGLLLYLLYRAAAGRAWPAGEPLLFAPLMMVCLFVPVLLISGLGHMPRRRLLLWGLVAALVLAGLGCHDAWRVADLPLPPAGQGAGSHAVVVQGMQRPLYPSAALLFFSAAGLFIAHSLVLAAVRDRRRIAAYATHFDIAWKLGVQLAFSALFTGVAWLVLTLGAQLFELVKLDFLTGLMRKPWFAIPVTAFAFACAMHLTDVRPAIVRGIRGLLLVLLSWLLPVTVLLVGGFLATLPFTGLAPLWNTKHAATVLLCAAAAFVVLVNAAWQHGGDETAVARPVRVCARIAALLLAPLVAIAVYALFLRVRDYGWTADRVSAAACMLVAACYTIGYFRAGLRAGWLPSLARVNIATAFVAVGVLLALFSPLLDPARVSVASQLDRLATGRVKPDAFDYAYLRFDGQRFGRAALDRLERSAGGPDAALVRQRIASVRGMQNRWNREAMDPAPDLAANLTVHPAGARLPDRFLRTEWAAQQDAYLYPECLRRKGRHCDAVLLDVTGDGKPEVMLLQEPARRGEDAAPDMGALVLSEDTQGQWTAFAQLSLGAFDCQDVRDKLAAGAIGVAAAALPDVVIGGVHARLLTVRPYAPCRNERRRTK